MVKDGFGELKKHPHRRFNPLTGDWVLVSPHRTQRPWQGQVEKTSAPEQQTYDPNCYLCPGNTRAGSTINPKYTETFVFENDFAALKADTKSRKIIEQHGLIVAEAERGICKVVCFSPRHDLTLAQMLVEDIRKVVDVWCHEYRTLGSLPYINYVQVFENRGEMMGCSNPHPHGQIWANETIPNEVGKEGHAFLNYHERTQSCLLCDYVYCGLGFIKISAGEMQGFSALLHVGGRSVRRVSRRWFIGFWVGGSCQLMAAACICPV